MTKLFAIPFEPYKTEKTDEGTIFNLVDRTMTTQLQIWVTHIPYSDHDLCIKEISQCPSNVRNKAIELLNKRYPEGWEVVTRFSMSHKRQSSRLQKELFAQDCLSISYNKSQDNLSIRPPKIYVD